MLRNTASWKGSLIRLAFKLCIVILMIVALYEIEQQLEKYLSGQTTVASTVEKHDTQQFPAISICPGFRHDAVVTKYPWLLVAFSTTSAVANLTQWFSRNISLLAGSSDELQEIWNDITYDLDDYFISYRDTSGQIYLNLSYQPTSSGSSSQEMWVERHDTYCGKCYTFHILNAVRALQYLTISLDLTVLGTQSIIWYIHNPKGNIMLNGAYSWIGSIFAAQALSNQLTKIDLVKEYQVTSSSLTGGEVINEEDYYDCVNNWIRMYLENASKSNDIGCSKGAVICYFPMFAGVYALANMTENFPPCLDVRDFLCSLTAINNMLTIYRDSVTPLCDQPTNATIYTSNVMYDPTRVVNLEGWSAITISFKNTDVTIQEELPLMDWFDLVSAVGGIVGFFLGWSFRDLVVLARTGLVKVGFIQG